MRVSAVIPAYNECWTIREIVRRVLAASEHLHEIVIVDDGSTDGTKALIQGLVDKHKGGKVPVRAVYREKNGGKGLALQDGFKAAEGEIIVVQDADLEYDPSDYPQLLQPIIEGRADVVYGSRFTGARHNVLFFWHTLANRLLTLMCNLASNLNLTDVWTGYKAFRADIIRKLPLSARGFDFEPEVTIKLAQLGCRIYEVPVQYHGRTYAEGKKIRATDALIGTWCMLKTLVAGDLGELAVGEQTLRVMSKAGRYNRFLYEQYAPHLGPEVVEVGAGAGNLSRYLLDRERVVLTDQGAGYLEMLRRVYKGWGYVEVAPLDLIKPGPEAGKLWGRFDAAVCLNVVEHIDDDKAAVASVARLLKPGGRAVFIVPAHQWLYGSLDEALDHFRRYGKDEFEALLAGAGLETVELRYLNPLAVPGWFLNGRVLGRRIIPGLQLALFDRLCFLLRWWPFSRPPFGISVFAVARKVR